MVKPILEIDEGHAVEKHFHFIWLKDRDPFCWKHSLNACSDMLKGSSHLNLSVHLNAQVNVE